MSSPLRDRVAELRQGIDIGSSALAYQQLYERWLVREHWILDSEALPLVVGVAPEDWTDYLDERRLHAQSDELLRDLSATLHCKVGEQTTPLALRGWSRAREISLPEPFELLLNYLVQVLPNSAAGDAVAIVEAKPQSAERELILGAALALVTRFPADCRDEHGFFDGALIADLMIQQAALWFPGAAPELSRAEIAELLEYWLR